MKRLLSVFFCLLILAGCASINLNRVKGIRGEYAPKATENGVLFSIKVPEATLVTIAGNFNGWDGQVTPMTKDVGGVWSIELPLEKGQKYYYKFLVDGFWIADPDNTNTVSDGGNGVNSVVEIK